ncbi:DnaJ C-terminal domain-containing protein [Ideonella livida]|uniref:J domain-containing protein n=1 Tax=Ideonella livida TaxID=2707176 RepID=A0A7C9PKS2_9BURK|nr:DnaJ C-terminal domain-containing protein [Ideonella livida]NDY93710.1 J domain-containing protein [Ideonella livida]
MDIEAAWSELGLPPGAPEPEIKRAWRRGAARWHPDRNPSPEAVRRMQRLNQAMERLRAHLAGEDDTPPEAPPAPEAEAGPAPGARDHADARADAHADAHADARGDTPPHPHTVARTLTIDLESAALGTEQLLEGEVADPCSPCGGHGTLGPPQVCGQCQGSGRVRPASWFPWLPAAEQECPHCLGHGHLPQTCPDCQGRGTQPPRPWSVRVRLPAGVRDGMDLHIPAGRAGGSHPGVALALTVAVAPHPFFSLEGGAGEPPVLALTLPVDALAWLAGATVQVPVPGGWQPLALQPPAVFHRLEGQGFPATPRGPRGALEVRLQPQFPVSLDGAQRAALRALSEQTRRAAEALDGHPLQAWQAALARRPTAP